MIVMILKDKIKGTDSLYSCLWWRGSIVSAISA